MMTPLVVLVESAQQLAFFARFAPSAAAAGHRLRVITARWSDAFRAQRSGIVCLLVSRGVPNDRPADIEGTGELMNGVFSRADAERYYHAFSAVMHRLVHGYPSGIVMLWGGGDTIASRAIRSEARHHGWKTLYVDRANLLGRIIVDPHGMNFSSYLAAHPELLAASPSGDPLGEMRTELESITERRPVRTHRNWFLPLDMLASAVNGIPFRGKGGHAHPFAVPKQMIETRPLGEERITLVPLNHSFELRSVQEGGLGFIDRQLQEAHRISTDNGAPIVVTLHPLEQDAEMMERLGALHRHIPFSIRQESSSQLLGNAVTVVASNTSVALEALIRDIPVVHVGRTLFGDMDRSRLAAYLGSYLLPVDPAASEPIPETIFRRMIERTEWR